MSYLGALGQWLADLQWKDLFAISMLISFFLYSMTIFGFETL